MLTEKQIAEIKEHLERAQNPIFYYDNDADGLCSFLILRRFLGRGKGVAIRSYPDLDARYARKAQELNADYVFILDKPVISSAFLDELEKMHLPIVWIDHHDIESDYFLKYSNAFLFNPAKNSGKDKSSEPVTYIAYKLTERKEDLWIGLIGCIADHYIPDFADEFASRYPDFWAKDLKKPFDVYFKAEIGRIAQALNFGLKDSVTHIVQLQNFLIECKGPNEVFLEIDTNRNFRAKYNEVRKKYDALLERAKKEVGERLIFFDYSGTLSISADLSNELSYLYPDKYVVVAYRNNSITNISLRGKKIREILARIIGKFEGASGGGHEEAVGARIKTADLERFKKSLEEEILR